MAGFFLGACLAYASVFVACYLRVRLSGRGVEIGELREDRAEVPGIRIVHLFRDKQ